MKRSLSDTDRHISKRIREQRRLVGMTQEELGTALGITFQQVQKYEKAVNRVTAGRLQNIATILGVSIDYFYEGLADGASLQQVWDKPASVILTTPEGQRLVNALASVKDAKLRDMIVDMVETIARNPDAAPPLGEALVD